MDKPRIERREQGLEHQIRRICFGMALAYSLAPMAAEIPTPVSATPSRRHTDSATLNLEPAVDQPLYAPYKALGVRYSDDSAQSVLSHTRFDTDVLNLLRAGVGVDFTLSEIGNLHFNLYSRDGDLNKGQRWTLSTSDSKLAPVVCKKIWSLGGKLDLARTHVDGPRTVVFIPQLMFNLESLGGLGNRAQLTFQYQHWSNGSYDDDDRAVPQLELRWSF
jgi:hypothetical protein